MSAEISRKQEPEPAATDAATDAATRVAAVTGGAGAIGASIVKALCDSGHTVSILDRAGEEPVDLADHHALQSAAADLLRRHGRCDVLVHAAAAFDRASLADLDPETWRKVQAVNVESALWLAQAFAPGMAERGFGRIVFVVSDTVWEPPAGDLLAYVASKSALIGIARTLARSLGRDGITVNCVAPGLTPTAAAVADTPPEAFEQVKARQAIDRPLAPEDVAATVAFLAGDAAGAITGQTLCTDGGLVLR
jgi:NAD(P)-dependent dehydrogenase (short-subunit alcohol dehydrogenase family)